MRVFYVFLGTALLFPLVFTEDHEGEDDNRDHKEDNYDDKPSPYLKIAPYNSRFSFDLFRQVALDHPFGNIVFSPVSISTALAFLSLGAKSPTRSQIIKGLRFNTSDVSEQEIHEGFHNLLVLLNDVDRKVQLSCGSALFITKERKVLQSFVDEAKLYHSELCPIDFKNTEEARSQINSYVEKNTNGEIPEVLDSVAEDTILALINYIYFKGKWEKPFDENLTQEGDFHVNEKTMMKVPFMSRTGMYNVAFTDDATVVSIPYAGGDDALFILPKEGKLSEVEQNYNEEAINKWKKSMSNELLKLYLPKFSATISAISATINLEEIFRKLGMEDVFSDNADFSGITGEADTTISMVVHKAGLSVDERGADVSDFTAHKEFSKMAPIHINFNRPYIFSLYDYKLRTALIIGRAANPMN